MFATNMNSVTLLEIKIIRKAKKNMKCRDKDDELEAGGACAVPQNDVTRSRGRSVSRI